MALHKYGQGGISQSHVIPQLESRKERERDSEFQTKLRLRQKSIFTNDCQVPTLLTKDTPNLEENLESNSGCVEYLTNILDGRMRFPPEILFKIPLKLAR